MPVALPLTHRPPGWWLLVLLTALLGCSPALDWREVRAPDSPVQVLFPCKPSAQERRVALAGRPVRLTLLACAADGQTWGLAYADLADPGLLGQAQRELLAAAAANLGTTPPATAPQAAAWRVSGATPHAESRQQRLQGVRPDGQAVQMTVAVFAHGTWVYQASALGAQVPAEAAQTFFESLRFAP